MTQPAIRPIPLTLGGIPDLLDIIVRDGAASEFRSTLVRRAWIATWR